MFTIALFGAGKIGDAICALLAPSGRYTIRVCDASEAQSQKVAQNWGNPCSAHVLNIKDSKATMKLLEGCDAVLSALPFYCNVAVAEYAKNAGVHYFDLTEDVATTKAVADLSKGAKTAFLPQCGVAPGFISIAAAHVTTHFEEIESIKMRVGALPIYPSNRLKYNLTWSTEGLINEYGNMCEVVEDGAKQLTVALEGYERFSLDGIEYEAFNTSGGLGTLCETLEGKVKNLNYKTVRYPGHRDLIAFLMQDLKFNDDRTALKEIFERSIPTTTQDKCIIFVEAKGKAEGRYVQRTYASTVYNEKINGVQLGAIQITTASGICAPLDLLLTGKLKENTGMVRLESIPLSLFLSNDFGKYYTNTKALQ